MLKPIGIWFAIFWQIQTLAGGWQEASIDLVNQRNKDHYHIYSPICLTIREQVQSGAYAAFEAPDILRRVSIPLDSKAFAKPISGASGSADAIDGYVGWSDLREADLVVILPGIFQAADHAFPKYFASMFHRRGYHVLTFPSPFSKAYLARMPYHSIGSFESEAQVYLEAIKNFKKAHAGRIMKVHIFALSYTTFIAAVMLALDKDSVISGDTTFLGPLFKMSTTQLLLDQMVDEGFQRTYLSPCTWAAASQTLPDLIRFTESLVDQYQYFRDVEPGGRPYSDSARAEYKKVLALSSEDRDLWRDSLRFRNIMARYTTENLHYYEGGQDELAYWLGLAVMRGYNGIRLLTTKDDFMNDPGALKNSALVPEWLYTKDYLLTLNFGSHIGYTTWNLADLNWFEHFMDSAFPPYQRPNPRAYRKSAAE